MRIYSSQVPLIQQTSKKYDISKRSTANSNSGIFRGQLCTLKIPFLAFKYIHIFCSQPYTTHLKQALAKFKTVIKISYTEIQLVC